MRQKSFSWLLCDLPDKRLLIIIKRHHYLSLPLLYHFTEWLEKFCESPIRVVLSSAMSQIILSEAAAEKDKPRFIAHSIKVTHTGVAMTYGSSSSPTPPHRPLSIRQVSPYSQIENLSMIVGICRQRISVYFSPVVSPSSSRRSVSSYCPIDR